MTYPGPSDALRSHRTSRSDDTLASILVPFPSIIVNIQFPSIAAISLNHYNTYGFYFLALLAYSCLSKKKDLSFRGGFIFYCLNNHLLYCGEKPKAVSVPGLGSLANSPPPTPSHPHLLII